MKTSTVIFMFVMALLMSCSRNEILDSELIKKVSSIEIPRNGLAGEWLFEGDANDTSGNNKHGSVTGAIPGVDRFGNAGKAYSFDGNDYILLPASNSIIPDISSSYTVSAWFKVTSVVNNHTILTAYNYNGSENIYFAHCYIYPFLNKNKIYNGLKNTSPYTYISENYDSVSDGLWHHVLLITDNSSLKHQMYIDNYLVYETAISKQNYIDDGVLRVGASYYSGLTNYFNGFIDDIRIYNRVLNSDEISAIYHENNWKDKVAKPVFSKTGGMYSGSQNVTLSSSTTGAEIYYTTDGSEPSTSTNLYTTPISIPALSTTTIKAKAFKSGYIDSFPETNKYSTVSGYVLQPGPENGEDTLIGSVYDRDYSTGEYSNRIKNGGWGDEYDALIRFDVFAAPTSPTSAKLYLYSVDDTSTVCTMYLEKITSTWDESTVRWTSRPTFSNISTIPAPTKGQWYSIDITSLYNDWKSSPSTNYGLMLRPSSTSNTNNIFYSSNLIDDTSLRPYLLVE